MLGCFSVTEFSQILLWKMVHVHCFTILQYIKKKM